MGLFGNTYGALGGAAAAGQTQGFQQGYKYIEDRKDQATRRKIMQDEWNIKSELMKTQLWDAYAGQMRKQQLAQEKGSLTPENIAYINSQLDNLDVGFKKQQGFELKKLLNDYLSTPNDKKRDSLEAIKNTFKQNPALANKFGPNFNPNSLRMLEPTSKRDMSLAVNHMITIDPEFAHRPKEEQEKMIKEQMQRGNLVESDGNVINMEGLGMGLGSLTIMDGKQKAMYEANYGLNQKQPTDAAIDDYIVKTESGGSYTAKNPTSSAYGKYQVTDATNEAVAKRLGMTPEEARTPTGQERVYEELKKEYTQTLNSLGVPITAGTMYAVHQLGSPRATRYFTGNLTSKDIKVMNDNLPESLRSNNPQEVVERWTNRYVKAGNGGGQPQQGQPQQGQAPYSSGLTKADIDRGLTGWGSAPTALESNYSFISDVAGADTADAWLNAQINPAQADNAPKYSWQQAIQAKDQSLQEQIEAGLLTPEEAKLLSDNYKDSVLTSQALGSGYAADQSKAKLAVSNSKLWEYYKKKGDLSNGAVVQAMQNEKMLKPLDVKTKEQLTASTDIAERALKIARGIESNPDGFLRGGAKGLVQQGATVVPDLLSWLDSMSGKSISKEELQKKLEATIGLNTELGMLASDYLKMQSGTAVPTEEFNRLIGGVLIGLDRQDPALTAKALKKFADVNSMATRQRADKVGMDGYTYSAYTTMKGIDNAYKRYGYKLPEAATLTGSPVQPEDRPLAPAVKQVAPTDAVKAPVTQVEPNKVSEPLPTAIPTYNSPEEVEAAFNAGKLKVGDTVIVNGQEFEIGA